ncbi:MAG: bifunctional 4-hydroxy-2-oxoglutarate aldolase/2-dehydro-3-deoxy-phosphogluconate aldolase [Deinococcota bacterium]
MSTSENSWIQTLEYAKIVGVLRAASPENATSMATTAFTHGLRSLELTFTVPDAANVIRELINQHPNQHIGAGTVTQVSQARAAIDAGAQYLVSPSFSVEVASVAQDANVPYIPGVLTPTEVQTALDAGIEVVKIFPITRAGGVSYLKDLLGPYPDLKVMVTGGVTLEQTSSYLDAGALAVGLGSVFKDASKLATTLQELDR